ncbi:MAG: PRC-barrel domain-containing protein [Candidatus Sulfotelmatobacter sp.]
MLQLAGDLRGYKLIARDGEIGKAEEFYFDDQSWAVRYLIANTGGWLGGRQVLISPYALDPARQNDQVLPVDLTKKQIENSPSLDTHKPVSRQYEILYYSFYGWPAYWGGPYMWGDSAYPQRQGRWSGSPRHKKDDDPHLRSTNDVTGRTIQARDGEIGHVSDFVVDDEDWAIRYLIVETRNWWPGKKVLISTQWIERISWEESKVFINLTREAVKGSPEYTEEALITRDYEEELHRHYLRERYWHVAEPGRREQKETVGHH